MSLKSYRAPKQNIALPDGTEFSVRGLTFHDLGALLEDHRDEFLAAGQIIAKQDAENMGSLASVLAQTVPDLAAAVSAWARKITSSQLSNSSARWTCGRSP